MDAPRLLVNVNARNEIGLYVRDACARDAELLALHHVHSLNANGHCWPLDREIHLRSASDLHALLPHACSPNAYVDWNACVVRALRALRENEELTINWLTLYDVIPTPFRCRCGSPECLGLISGFCLLPLEQKLKLELYLSPHLKRLLNDDANAARARAG